MTMPERDEIEEMFAMARAAPRPAPSTALMARVLADALAHQPRPAGADASVAGRARGGWLSALAAAFGGAGALAGVGGAALAGVLIGIVQPAPVTRLADAVLGVQVASVQLMPTADSLVAGE